MKTSLFKFVATVVGAHVALCSLLWIGPVRAADPDVLPMLDCVIEPYEVVEVSSAAEGVIERVHVERNDLVGRGQVVAEMESEVERASLAFAELNASLTTEIQLRRVSLEFDERNRDRIETLYKKAAIPLHHKDEAQTDAAKSRWLLRKATDDKRLAGLELAKARAVVRRKTVVSPITGVVVARHKSAGEYIEDEAIATIAQLHPLRVEVIAPVELFGRIAEGTEAEIFPELIATGTRRAIVTSVDRVIDGASGTFDVRLELPNPDYAIPSGLKCQVAFSDVMAPEDERPQEDPVFERDDPAPEAPAPAPAAPGIHAGGETTTGRSAAAVPAPVVPAIPAGKDERTGSKPADVPAVVLAPVASSAANDATPRSATGNDHGSQRPVAAGASCLVVGPFPRGTDLTSTTAALKPVTREIAAVVRLTDVTDSYIVVSRPVTEKSARDALRGKIASHGIEDTAWLGNGDFRDRVSFGVFRTRRIAEQRLRELERQGFDITIEPRVRERPRAWLQVTSDGGDAAAAAVLATAREISDGVRLEAADCESFDPPDTPRVAISTSP